MSELSLIRAVRFLGCDSASELTRHVGLTWPPPPALSLRDLILRVRFGAVVLSGGGSRTDFQVGAVRYVLDRGFDMGIVCAASGGAPNAAKLAEGEGTGSLERYWTSLHGYTDVYAEADWLADVSQFVRCLMLHHGESLSSLVTGVAAGAIGKLLDLPSFITWAESIPTMVTLTIDLSQLIEALIKITESNLQSILTPGPLRARLEGSGSGWQPIGGASDQAVSLAVIRQGDSRLAAFIVGADTSVHQAAETTPGGIWGPWTTIGGPSDTGITVSAVVDGHGGIQVFMVGSDHGVYHAVEPLPGAGFEPWTRVGGPQDTSRMPIVTILDASGCVHVFIIGEDEAVHATAETVPGTAVYGPWSQVGGPGDLGTTVKVGLNANGSLDLILLGLDSHVYHAVGASGSGPVFGPWEQVGGAADLAIDVDVSTDSAGFLQVARTAPDGVVYVARQLLQGFYLGPWQALPDNVPAGGAVAYGHDGLGRLHLVMTGVDHSVNHAFQEVPGGTWTSWYGVGPGGFAASVATATNSAGQAQIFIRGQQLEVLTAWHVTPLLDLPKVQASGIKVRLSTTALESGDLRYVTELGQFLDDPAAGQFSLAEAVIASGSLPIVFPPVKLLDQNYVDGGLRDLLPVKAAIDAGADLVIEIVAGQPVLPAEPSFDSANMFQIGFRAISDIMPNQILRDHLNPAEPWPVPSKTIATSQVVHGELAIDPGLMAISIDYGYMRAYDDMDPRPNMLPGDPGPALHENSDAIVALRLQIWSIEHIINGQYLPLQEFTQMIEAELGGPPQVVPVTDSTEVPGLREMKWQLKALVDERRTVLLGRVPGGVAAWWQNWEQHYFTPMTATPWDEINGTVAGGPVAAAPPPLGSDNTVTGEEDTDFVYILFGGGKFAISGLPWNGFTRNDVINVPAGALRFDQTLAADGTVVAEDTSEAPLYVIFGGAKFEIPGLPWPGALPGTSAGAVNGVNIVPAGSLAAVSDVPADGTVLTAVNPDGSAGSSFVVFGGAKFEIPADVLLDETLSLELGYGYSDRSVPAAAMGQIPDVPADGTVLQEIHGTYPYLITQGSKAVIHGARRFFELGCFWPEVGVLFDHGLDRFPDAGAA